jgi:5-methylcytosine-specific restriction protein A
MKSKDMSLEFFCIILGILLLVYYYYNGNIPIVKQIMLWYQTYNKYLKMIMVILILYIFYNVMKKTSHQQMYDAIQKTGNLINLLKIKQNTPYLEQQEQEPYQQLQSHQQLQQQLQHQQPHQQSHQHNLSKRNKRSVSETKKKWVASQQDWACKECHEKLSAFFEIDHITRLEYGGTNDASNLMALCRECHAKKTAFEIMDR